jgi:hypothetical protein
LENRARSHIGRRTLNQSNLKSEKWWLLAALAVAAFYSVLVLRLAFRIPNLVQDDARQHIFWMRRYLDPTLFPNDLIANYFQAIGPAGYKAFYWIFAKFGVDPMLVGKLLPAIVLGPACVYLCFRVFMELLPDPRGAFFSSALLCQVIWLKDDVISATPRAFAYPLFLLFLLFLLRRRLLLCLIAFALEGLFFPPALLVSIGIILLWLIQKEADGFHFSRERIDYLFCASALIVGASILFNYARSIAPFGPMITANAARAMPEFGPTGRLPFFLPGYHFWLDSPTSGFFPLYFNELHFAAALFPLLWLFGKFAERKRAGAALLFVFRIVIVSFALWAIAHALLFKLYLPNRYSWWVLYIIEPIAAGITITLLLNMLARFRWIRWLPHAAALFLLIYPHLRVTIPRDSYFTGHSQGLYSFLQKQPKDCVIASLSEEADMIPTFAQRSVLVGGETASSFYKTYYRQIRERGQDLIRAEYSPRLEDVRKFIRKYHVDLWIIDRRDFQPGFLSQQLWFKDIGDTAAIEESLRGGEQPALMRLVPLCNVYTSARNVVLDAHRIEYVDPSLIE